MHAWSSLLHVYGGNVLCICMYKQVVGGWVVYNYYGIIIAIIIYVG